MAITFYTQSKKNPAPIYVRLREGREIDAKAKTGKSIDPKDLVKGNIKRTRIPRNADAETKAKIDEYNEVLNDLEKSLNKIRADINTEKNNAESYEIINSQWLNNVLRPKSENSVSNDLIGYFDYYMEVRRKDLRESTLRKLMVIRNRVEAFESQTDKRNAIQEVNKVFQNRLFDWCDKVGYARNTKIKTLKVVATVCIHARDQGTTTHPELQVITKGLKYEKTKHIHLDFKELEAIANVDLNDNERLDIARDWLLISCYTAQRVSDFMKFDKKNIKQYGNIKLMEIEQEKTDKPVMFPILAVTESVLNKRDGEFPPLFSNNIESNKAIYNKLIKEVCRLAGIKETVSANRRNNKNRYEIKKMPKYKAVSTHIGRRSFATNYYGSIETSLLISATGHATEKQFLDYVGKTEKSKAVALAKAVQKLEESQGNNSESETNLFKVS